MEVRIDKWLWSVRLFKTRSLATGACRAGKVQVNGQPAKPARTVQVGDLIVADNDSVTRTVKVLALLEMRVGAPQVPGFLEEMTPPVENENRRQPRFSNIPFRPKGSGRPTKRDRRKMDGLN